jgi:hypothetical protein
MDSLLPRGDTELCHREREGIACLEAGWRQGETISAVLGRNVPVDDDIRDGQWSARIALLVSKRVLTSTIPATLVLSPESLLPKTALPLQLCPGK